MKKSGLGVVLKYKVGVAELIGTIFINCRPHVDGDSFIVRYHAIAPVMPPLEAVVTWGCEPSLVPCQDLSV